MVVALEAIGLSKSFRGTRAVQDLSLQVQEGEIYGFLGPNGAGKTTTLRMLLGLAKPDAGRACIRGVEPRDDPVAARRGVGYLPESVSFYPTLSGRQTLRFFADMKGAPRAQVGELLALVDLAADADRRVSEYSRGMLQSLGLAQALLGDPDILVLDEPLTGLDPQAQRKVKDLLHERARRGATLLFSSHQLMEVQQLAHRVGVLQRGRLIAEDTVANLRASVGLKGILVLTLERAPRGLLGVVRAMEGVDRAWLEGLRLFVACADARRFDVARAAHDAGAGVVGMETREPNLEDVFLQLTQRDATDEPSPEGAPA